MRNIVALLIPELHFVNRNANKVKAYAAEVLEILLLDMKVTSQTALF